MNVEILKGLLSDDTYQKVVSETEKKDGKLVDLTTGAFVSKEKHNALNEQLTTANNALAARTAELEALKEKAGDNDALKSEIEALKNKHEEEIEKMRAAGENRLKKATIANHIIQTYHPNDVNDVMPHLDIEKIEVEGDKVTKGIDEQINQLKESKAYYFQNSKNHKTGLEHEESEDDDPFLKGFKS